MDIDNHLFNYFSQSYNGEAPSRIDEALEVVDQVISEIMNTQLV